MSIHRPQEPTRNFTKSARAWVRSPDLSGKAKGYLSYICSHAAGYDLTVEQMVAEMAEGPAAVRAGLAELEEKGYLRRPRRRNADGTLGGYDWIVIDFPNKTAGGDQVAEIESGSDQGERDVSAGEDQLRKPQPGSDQQEHGISAGHDQSAEPQPGDDQPKQGVSAGGNQTRKSNPKETKETREGDKEKTMERSEVECLPSGRSAPSGAGDTDDQPLILVANSRPKTRWTDWRQEDLELLTDLIGSDKVISDGSTSKAGAYPVQSVYDSLLAFPGDPKEWPGMWMQTIHENNPTSGVLNWLARYGLEPA